MGKILIVDDDKLIVSALSIRLRAEGHETLAAYDGTSAVEQVKAHAPSLIIMDINLPFSSGLRAVKQIREATGASQTPVIFLTASKVPALREQAIALGAAGFLEKPYDANQLAVLVRGARGPIVPSAPSAAGEEGSAPEAENRTILVVDEEKKIADAIGIRVRSEGYTVVGASDPSSAVKLRVCTSPRSWSSTSGRRWRRPRERAGDPRGDGRPGHAGRLHLGEQDPGGARARPRRSARRDSSRNLRREGPPRLIRRALAGSVRA
jgi:CheY-like chemotaxis protein